MTKHFPEQKLWAYVLGQAIDDVHLDPNPKGKVAKAEHRFLIYKAKSWFTEGKRKFSDEICNIEGADPQAGSFEWICTELGLDAGEIREMVLG